MLNKIVFLCANPMESFLPRAFQGSIKSYYERICKDTFLREESVYCQEKITLYGESEESATEELFEKHNSKPQILYVQSNQKDVLTEACETTDLVIVAISGSKKECDKMFLSILPWKEKTIFLWNEYLCDKKFLKQLRREYGLKEKQLLEVKKLPPFLAEALKAKI